MGNNRISMNTTSNTNAELVEQIARLKGLLLAHHHYKWSTRNNYLGSKLEADTIDALR